jgi:hypothetical protein
MFVKIIREQELFRIDATPVTIVAIDDAAITVEVQFKLLRASTRRGDAVRVTAFSRVLQRSSIVSRAQSNNDRMQAAVDAICSQITDAKLLARAQERFVVASRLISLRTLFPAADRTGKRLVIREHAELVSQNESTIALRTVSGSDDGVPRIEGSQLFDIIAATGRDPSDVVLGRSEGAVAERVVGGLATSRDVPLPAALVRYLAVLTKSTTPTAELPTDAGTSATRVEALDDEAPIECRQLIRFPVDRLMIDGTMVSHVTFRAEILDEDAATIDAVTFGFDLATHKALFATPRRPPRVCLSQSTTGGVLLIKPGDAATAQVRVLRRVIARVGPIERSYTEHGVYRIDASSHTVRITLAPVHSAIVLYRVIPIGTNGQLGAEYTTVVQRPFLPAPVVTSSITTSVVRGGMLIEVRGIPSRAVSIDVLRRDLTLRDSSVSVIGRSIRIDDEVRAAGFASIVDGSVTNGRLYEYSCRLLMLDGRRITVGSVHTEYQALVEDKIRTTISDLRSTVDDEGQTDVTFGITTSLLDGDADALRALLIAQGVSEMYADEMLADRDKLRGLIAHHVMRTDLSTGEQVDFGVIIGTTFVDSAHRVRASAPPVLPGRRYRYEIAALVRAPETLFVSYVKPMIDAPSRKAYTMIPSKHLHPVTLKTGVITTAAGLATRFAKSAFDHGRVGSITAVEIETRVGPAFVTDAVANQIDSRTVSLTWRVDAPDDVIDHFIVVSTTEGVRRVLGRCHTSFARGGHRYLHTLTNSSPMRSSYTIVPIMIDYSPGVPTDTNEITVED